MAFRGPDRRLRTRFRIQIPFLLKGDSQEVQGITRNVSLLGISAFANASFPQAQPVRCILNLSSPAKPIVAHGTIIHCEPLPQPVPEGSHEIGVFFKEFEETGEPMLARFLEQLVHKEEEALKAGYRALKQKLAIRKRRKRLEELRKQRRRLARLRRRRQRLEKLRRQRRATGKRTQHSSRAKKSS